jgi:membrane protease YdiL (CAAX protease family)
LDLRVSNPLKRYPLASFFVLAYGIAWAGMALLAAGEGSLSSIGTFGPAIAALVVTAANEGKAGVQTLVARLFLWRAGVKWYLIALLAPVTLELLAIPLHQLAGSAAPQFDLGDWLRLLPSHLVWLIPIVLFLVVLSSGEEAGWRGYALPRLQARYGPLPASLILGLLWGLWHLPLFWMPGTPQYGLPVPGYVLATVGYAIIYTCIYNGSKGSVLLACLYHAASNATLLYANAIFPAVIRDLYLSLPALGVLVIIVLALSGPGVLARRQFGYDMAP